MTTTTGASLVTLYCPYCGNDDIAGCDTIPGLTGIVGWRINPSTGKREPEWEGSTDVAWNQQRPAMPEAPYCCRRCGEFVAAAQLDSVRHERRTRKPKRRTAPPVARVVIVIDDGKVQVLYANELVRAMVVDRGSIARQLQQLNAPGATPDGPTATAVAVEIRREYVDSVFAGQL